MRQLFLTSEVSRVAQDIAKRMETREKKLVFIYTATESEGGFKERLADDRKSLIDIGFHVTNYTLTGKTQVQVTQELKVFDTIYVSGGNTFYLLQQAQLSGFVTIIRDLVIKQNKTYIGTSAGSIIAGPDISSTIGIDNLEKAPKLKGYKGFDLINFCVFPHWGSDFFKDLYLNQRLEHAYVDDQVPLIALTNSQYVHVRDDWMQVVDVKDV